MSPNHAMKMEQSHPSGKVATKQGRLHSLMLKDGNLHLVDSQGDLPRCVIDANAAIATGRVDEAGRILKNEVIGVVREVLNGDPSRTDVMLALAMLFKQTNQINEAKKWFETILQQEPHPLVYNELGYVYQHMGVLAEAIQYYRKAVDTDDDNPQLWPNLANMLIQTGKIQQGVKLLRKAVEKEPTDAAIHSNLLFCLHYLPELDPQTLFEEHKRWGRLHAPAGLARSSHKNDRDPDRRLRIGYISPDFRVHPVAYFFESLVDGHNRHAVEVYGYGDVAMPDQVTERLKSKFCHYRNIRGLGDDVVDALIEQDRIDILVELAGHTADNRLLLVARKPAPIQVTYLGAPDTTGIEAIDYRFTDVWADSPDSQRFYTEELVFLPKGCLCYRPAEFTPPLSPLPAFKNNYITFASFNSISKINPKIIELWAKVLNANPDSRFVLKFGISADRRIRRHYFRQFEKCGISSERLAIYGWQPIDRHFGLYSQVDIALDTCPFNGYTTTCEALWMGVPTISLVGQSHASRIGLSILNSVDLSFFAASTPEEYLAKANALAQNRDSLAQIRVSMRARMAASTLGNEKLFTSTVETAYRKMWHRWLERTDANCKMTGED